MGNIQNQRSLCAVDNLMHCCLRPDGLAEGNSESDRPQHLGSDNFDCCPRRHEIVVYYQLVLNVKKNKM